MRLVQFLTPEGARRVGVVSEDGRTLAVVAGAAYVRDLALEAWRGQTGLAAMVAARVGGESVSYDAVYDEGRLLPPLDHPDPAHVILSGTGLDHLGSAQARDAMHAKLRADDAELTDSMKMFKLGLEGGRPASGQVGVSPEWFYKGDGSWVVGAGPALAAAALRAGRR